MTLLLSARGVATAYATVGVGDVKEEINSAVKAVDALRSRPTSGEDLKAVISEPESIFLLGQADVATVIETSNFKRIFDLSYPRVESHASVVNWVFSVPYDGGRESVPTDPDQFRFLLHLRLRRSAYAFRDIEEAVVKKIEQLLGKLLPHARIHVGLGWSDLIVDGFFTPKTFQELATFIIQSHGLRVRYGSGKAKYSLPVLQRMLTVIGYTGDTPPKFARAPHVTFLRAKPGEYNTVEKTLRKFGDAYTLDGKADFMVVTSKSKTKANWLAKQRELGELAYRDSLRKVETHLMMLPAKTFQKAAAAEELYIDIAQDFDRDRCACEHASDPIVPGIVELMNELGSSERRLLPTEQRYAIDNTLFLLKASLRDASICCDSRDAVLASYDGLLKVLRNIDLADKEPADPPNTSRHRQIVASWRRLDEWHRFTELLLRQRTVGSFEEILGQSDRSVVYSGGVQKFLYLADQLLADFASRVRKKNETPRFATIYDSVKTILSFRTGIVRIPTNRIFSFPFVVPDLWHEVGGTLFFLRLARQFSQYAPPGQENTFLENLADHYADVLVYLYGFGADFKRFLASLAHGWRLTYGDLSTAVQNESIGPFLARSYLIYEFDQIRALQNQPTSKKVKRFVYHPNTIKTLVGELEVLLRGKHPKIAAVVTDDHWQLLRLNAKSADFSQFHRALYTPFVDTVIQQATPDLSAFKRGEIVSLDDSHDLNSLFGELAYQMIISPNDPHFRGMAALGKSAAIEYHRRQIGKRDRFDPPPRPAAPLEDSDVADPDLTPRKRSVPKTYRTYATRQRIDKRYEVVERRGAGGTGEVYQVKDHELKGRIVALKMALPGSGELEEKQLRTELEAARAVTHENICQVYDFGRDVSRRMYITMEFVGEDLKKRLERLVRIPRDQAVRLARDLFSGLTALHHERIVHGDIKPSNILIDPKNDRAKISDCGLAVLSASAPRSVAGTWTYMAPEQIRMEPASFKSDVYSAGLVLFEAVSGERAIDPRSPDFLASHDALQRRRPNSGRKAIDDLIMRALAPNPEDRPTATQMLEEWRKLARRL